MNKRGQVFENPVSGERVVVLTDPDANPDGALVAHLTVRPGGRVAAAHIHPTIRERFHVLQGEVGLLLGEEERVLGAGESAEIPAGTVHDWWQLGEDKAQVVVEVEPGSRFTEMVGTMFGLARDGKVDKRGVPRPLQLAVTAREYGDVMVVLSPPPWAQRLLFGVLAPLGRRRGLQPKYERYLSSDIVVEPDPRALALLDADGRLRT
jgi:mannose-6-phosphate isomerase-like protein (cupin superfamily)